MGAEAFPETEKFYREIQKSNWKEKEKMSWNI